MMVNKTDMCGRFTLRDPRRVKLAHLDYLRPEDLIPRYNIAPTQNVLTIQQHKEDRETAFLQWGLIPMWSKEPKGIINARVETIEQKASFSDSFEKRRCLIFADGFYEWERNGKVTQPYYFQMKDGAPFAFAGIWDRWQGAGRSITSCAIITTTANELLATIHHRMPVILEPESYDLWLAGRAPDVKSLLTPFPAAAMTSHTVSRDVNDVKIDDEHLVEPADTDVGINLRLF
jgi:putative SOS response-associated peptidase YedK